MADHISKAERAVINKAMAWQEYNDRMNCRWVRGSNISQLLTAARKLRKVRDRRPTSTRSAKP